MNTKEDIIRSVSARTKFPRDVVREVLDAFVDYVYDEVYEHGSFRLANLCTISSYPLPDRVTYDTKTGKMKMAPATARLTIRLSRNLRDVFHGQVDGDDVQTGDDVASER